MLPERPRMRPSPLPARNRTLSSSPSAKVAPVFSFLRLCMRGAVRQACVASLPPWPFSDFNPPQLASHRLCRAEGADGGGDTAQSPHCNRPGLQRDRLFAVALSLFACARRSGTCSFASHCCWTLPRLHPTPSRLHPSPAPTHLTCALSSSPAWPLSRCPRRAVLVVEATSASVTPDPRVTWRCTLRQLLRLPAHHGVRGDRLWQQDQRRCHCASGRH